METIQQMLEREYVATLDDLKTAQVGSEEARWKLQKLDEIHKHLMAENEANAAALSRDAELRLKETEVRLKEEAAEAEKKDRKWKRCVDVAEIGVPVVTTCYWLGKTMKFEETGTFTSRARQLVDGFFRMFRFKR